MGKLVAILLSFAYTLIGKVIAAIGLTAVTYVGLQPLLNNFKNLIAQNINGLPEKVLQLFLLSGGGTALNILFGCFTFLLTFKVMTKFIPKGKAKGV